MKSKRKRYYHKTIVVKDLFSKTLFLVFASVFTVSLMISFFGRFQIKFGRAYVMSQFDRVFLTKKEERFFMPTPYDHILRMIPAIRSSENMMKKYAAKYSGVKKQTEKEEEMSPIDNLNIKEMDMSEKGITFRNETAYTPNVQSLIEDELNIRVANNAPSVLVLHTHTSEAYSESPGARSTDNSKNVVRVGEVLKETLEKEGIGVIHDTTRNDYPAYNGSYTKALANITAHIEKTPSIKVVLDVHRDYAEQKKDGTSVQLKPVAEVNGEKVAQIMFVVGTDGLGLEHKNWKKNLAFAVQIQKELNQISPNLSRPINIRRERFNQHMTEGSLILEVGTAGNSLKECERAAVYVGESIARVMQEH